MILSIMSWIRKEQISGQFGKDCLSTDPDGQEETELPLHTGYAAMYGEFWFTI